jgi:hypothetical protein
MPGISSIPLASRKELDIVPQPTRPEGTCKEIDKICKKIQK